MTLISRILIMLIATPLAIHAETLVYFGTYTGKGSEGIYYSVLDTETGHLSEPKLAAKVGSPSFLALHPSGERLYSTSDVLDKNGDRTGGVSAFKIESNGHLALINQRPSTGSGPCHVGLDQTGKVLFVSNYSDGNMGSYPIDEDGSIKAFASSFTHSGSSINKNRQSSAHAHSTNVDHTNSRAYTADLGLDQIRIYKIDVESGQVTENSISHVATPPGGGVRHMSFNPSGNFAYANLELTSEIIALSHDRKSGEMKVLQTLSTLPSKPDLPSNSTAETLVHPSGKFVYVSNRGHNSIAIYAIDQETGLLSYLGNESTRGDTPRNFGIDPSGKFLLAANQNSDTVVSFKIDLDSGLLNWTGQEIDVPTPVCVRFLER